MSDPRHRGPCPLCGRPADAEYRPFCSRRCADIDLGNWLSGAYAIPSSEGPSPDEEEELEQILRRFEGTNDQPS